MSSKHQTSEPGGVYARLTQHAEPGPCWPDGTRRSTGNAFNWQGRRSVFVVTPKPVYERKTPETSEKNW